MNRVTTKYGKIEGIQEHGYAVYKGIPYAKPPVGALRFRAPEELNPWEGTYKAICFGNQAMQKRQDTEGFYTKEFYSDAAYIPTISEDCLYLNIWTPAESSEENLPVAFWIHGGGFMSGYGSEKEFDGAAYCKKNVILVTINYRLGVLGFLCHPWLRAESKDEVSGNYGILDQIAALRWVYENIAAFGGNPDNITLLGQSAGCMSVQTLASSPLANGLFAHAILQSGGGYQGGFLEDELMEKAEKKGMEIVALMGARTIQELRSIPAEHIQQVCSLYMLQMIKKAGKFQITIPFKPVVDGYVLPDGYDKIINDGKLADVPYIIGTCKNDMCKPTEEANTPEFEKLYKGAINFARKLSEEGKESVYVYRFDRQMPGDDAGAFHSAELWYMFGTYERCWRPLTDADAKLSEEMVCYWTNFCKTGNPNGEGIGEWGAYAVDKGYVKRFDTSQIGILN